RLIGWVSFFFAVSGALFAAQAFAQDSKVLLDDAIVGAEGERAQERPLGRLVIAAAHQLAAAIDERVEVEDRGDAGARGRGGRLRALDPLEEAGGEGLERRLERRRPGDGELGHRLLEGRAALEAGHDRVEVGPARRPRTVARRAE